MCYVIIYTQQGNNKGYKTVKESKEMEMKENSVKVTSRNLYMVASILRKLPNEYVKTEDGCFDGIYKNLSKEEIEKN